MDQERPEPIDGLSLLPSLFKAAGIVKSCRGLIEQAEHREVDLAVTKIASRIDQPRDPIFLYKDIPAPEISMEQRNLRPSWDMVGQAVGEPTDPIRQMWLDMGKMAAQAPLRPEFDPIISSAVGDGDRPETMIPVPARLLPSGSVKMIEDFGQLRPGARDLARARQILKEHQSLLDCQYRRDRGLRCMNSGKHDGFLFHQRSALGDYRSSVRKAETQHVAEVAA